VEKGASNAI
jgi:hypothetical protein